MTHQDLKQMALSAASTPGTYPGDPFAACYAQLCQVSYFTPSDIPAGVTKVNTLDPGGQWRCVWGPAQDWDESNLAFVAAYYSGGIPVFAVTVIRGTDFNIDNPLGILEQIWEDLDPWKQGNLPWVTDPNVLVAQGSLDGLAVIQGLSSGNQTVDQFLASFLQNPANQKPVLIVTGHSLGGCLTTLVAPWLQFQLKQSGVTSPMVPATFAGPTAGNAAFAKYYDSSFQYALRFYNTLDVAPMAFGNLIGIETIYAPFNLPIPDELFATIAGFALLLQELGISYAQPFTNNAPLKGQIFPTSDWYDEAFYQHHITTYMTIMGVPAIVEELWQPRIALGRPATPKTSDLVARTGGLKTVMENVQRRPSPVGK
jgi:triacylglycerol lipase